MDIEHKIYWKSMVQAFAEKQAKHDALLQEVSALVQPHLPTLSRKKQQKLIYDDYGQPQADGWLRELDYFIINVLGLDKEFIEGLATLKQKIIRDIDETVVRARLLPKDVRAALNQDFDQNKESFNVPLYETPLPFVIWQMIEQYEEATEKDAPVDVGEYAVENGHDYENMCKQVLTDLGWLVIHRGRSGDQGVDLIGELNGNRVAFQCKFYSSPVGNAAVQEVIAGMTYEGISTGAVITNSRFTIAAKQLANTAEVVLLHHDQLADFTSLVMGHA